MIILARAVHRLDLLDGVLSVEPQLVHHARELELRVAADENADHIGVLLEHLLAAAADDDEALARRRLFAQHGKGLFRHVDFKGVGIFADTAGGKEVHGLLVHFADHLPAVARRGDLLFDGILVVELDAKLLRDDIRDVMPAAAVLATEGNDDLLFHRNALLSSLRLQVPQEQVGRGYRHDDERRRHAVLAVAAPADGIAALGRSRRADDICARADGRRVAAEVRAERERPGEHADVHALRRRDGADDGDHGRSEGDIIHERARDSRDPQDDDHDDRRAAAADLRDKVRDDIENARLFKARHGDEQAGEEKQRLIVHALNNFYNRFFPAGQAQNDEREDRNDDADAGDGQLRLRVGDEQDDREQEHRRARKERLLIRDGRRGRGAGDRAAVGLLRVLQLLAEAQHKINEDEYEADGHDRTGIFDEIKERVAQRRTDDDIRRVAAHRRRAAEVGTENFR